MIGQASIVVVVDFFLIKIMYQSCVGSADVSFNCSVRSSVRIERQHGCSVPNTARVFYSSQFERA
jgi:hypothetical protein